MNDDEIVKECVYTVRDYIIKNNYQVDSPNEITIISIDKNIKTEEEHNQFLEKIKEQGITVIYNNVLHDGKHITAFDDINKNVVDVMYEMNKRG